MDSNYAKQFLSEESLEALDASKGAQILFVKIPKRDEIKEKHDAGVAMFNEKSAMIDERKKLIKKIDEKGFFYLIFNFVQLRKQRKLLESEILMIDNEITKILEETGAHYREMTAINKEIDDFKKTIRMLGLTLEDIKNEYFRIKAMLEREKLQAENDSHNAESKLPKVVVAQTQEQVSDEKNSVEKTQNQPN